MARYAYPAIFTLEKNGQYSINFPDLESCYTCGNTLEDGLIMAEDVLAYVLYDYERNKKAIPTPSSPSELKLEEKEFANYVACDTLAYRKRHNSQAVKKTLSIPGWLNEEAMERGINFSQVLQEALLLKIQGSRT